jgi:sugar/nucleoside kinase (ribokinase family)
MMKEGICVAGNVVLDILYPIEEYPHKGEMTTITSIKRATGGAVCNVGIDLAKLDPKIALYVVGKIGDDVDADYIESQLEQYENIDISGLKRQNTTSFSVIVSENTTKQRTVFQYRGANAQLCEGDFDFDKLDVKLMHIGYILSLEILDEEDLEYETKMARLLHKAQQRGIKTSVDVITEKSDRYQKLMPPALKYTDYCIINDLEAEQTTGVTLHDEQGRLLSGNMKQALSRLLDMGVSTWAVVHAVEGGFGMEKNGNYVEKPSLPLQPGYIKGITGAGDAFCAGVLHAAYYDQSLDMAIKKGLAATTCALSGEYSTEGMRSMEEALALYDRLRGR